MRTKSFAMLAISSLLTASIAYVAPAMADETSNSMPMEQMLADNSGTNSSMQMPAEANSAPQTLAENSGMENSGTDNSSSSNSDSAHANNQNDANNSSANNTSGSSDQGTPDTATGDDDY